MPTRAAARAACLSRAFLRSWRCYPNLDLISESKWNIDRILRNRSGIGLKTLELHLGGESSTFPYVDSWLQAAVRPGIEKLDLTLYKKYNFPFSLFSDGVRNSIRDLGLDTCIFRPTSQLGPSRRLTNLNLASVCITGDELECLLSNSHALEQLELFDCKEIIFLKIPCVLQQLSRLSVVSCYKLKTVECKAPNISIIEFSGRRIKLSSGQLLKMKDLEMSKSHVAFYAIAELPSIMPNLETLSISSDIEVINAPMVLTKFLYLKHLTIKIWNRTLSAPPYNYFSLVYFFDVSPSLETFLLEVPQEDVKHESVFGDSSHLGELPEQQYKCLKIVEISRFSSAKSLVELTCCIVKNAASLERLTLDTIDGDRRCFEEANETCAPFGEDVLKEASRAVVAIRMYIEQKVAPTSKLTVLGPCTRCHSH